MSITVKRLLSVPASVPTPALSTRKKTKAKSKQEVKYHVRVSNLSDASDIHAGLNVCFVNTETQDAILHRISPYPIPFTKYAPLEHTFEGADIGQVMQVLVSSESGCLTVHKIEIGIDHGDGVLSSLKTFVPSPFENVFIPQAEFCPERKARNDAEYKSLKRDIHITAAAYGMAGTLVTGFAFGSWEEAFAYATGAFLAALYNVMLQHETDGIGKNQRPFLATRLVTLAGFSALAVHTYADVIHEHNILYVLGFMGFLTSKMSIMRNFNKTT